MSPLISAEELHTLIDDSTGTSAVILDVRWALGDTSGRAKYLQAHIPGAIYVDLENELSGPASSAAGRHPLPEAANLQVAARSWGISEGTPVVVYDAADSTAAARAWWVLLWAGIGSVYLLDGGFSGWVSAGFATEAGAPTHASAGDVVLSAGHLPTLDANAAAALAHSGTLLDARAAERYAGQHEPIDPRAGHIPGAINAPTSENVQENGRFHPPEVLRARFERLGVRAGEQLGVYCGSGVTAAHQIAALAIAGYEAALYPGSWSQWSSDPSRPAATSTT